MSAEQFIEQITHLALNHVKDALSPTSDSQSPSLTDEQKVQLQERLISEFGNRLSAIGVNISQPLAQQFVNQLLNSSISFQDLDQSGLLNAIGRSIIEAAAFSTPDQAISDILTIAIQQFQRNNDPKYAVTLLQNLDRYANNPKYNLRGIYHAFATDDMASITNMASIMMLHGIGKNMSNDAVNDAKNLTEMGYIANSEQSEKYEQALELDRARKNLDIQKELSVRTLYQVKYQYRMQRYELLTDFQKQLNQAYSGPAFATILKIVQPFITWKAMADALVGSGFKSLKALSKRGFKKTAAGLNDVIGKVGKLAGVAAAFSAFAVWLLTRGKPVNPNNVPAAPTGINTATPISTTPGAVNQQQAMAAQAFQEFAAQINQLGQEISTAESDLATQSGFLTKFQTEFGEILSHFDPKNLCGSVRQIALSSENYHKTLDAYTKAFAAVRDANTKAFQVIQGMLDQVKNQSQQIFGITAELDPQGKGLFDNIEMRFNEFRTEMFKNKQEYNQALILDSVITQSQALLFLADQACNAEAEYNLTKEKLFGVGLVNNASVLINKEEEIMNLYQQVINNLNDLLSNQKVTSDPNLYASLTKMISAISLVHKNIGRDMVSRGMDAYMSMNPNKSVLYQ